jgi:WD40 repeat protein/tetratricopeptide (TPR) repeat protein
VHLVGELIALEIDLRRQMGEACQEDEYHSRFPSVVLPTLATTAFPGAASAPAAAAPVQVPGYEIIQELGRGGMGVVYWAWQSGLNRTVALKMILAGGHAGPEALARFRTEAEAVARLQHANIIQIHDIGEHDGRPYMALEYIDGGSLAEALNGTPWPARRAAALVETLARAIHHAHQQGIVHRDLTPGNVLMTKAGQPRITDFGLAKLLVGGGPTLTETGMILGTPSYMAPEQAAGQAKAIGPATDVYALGAVLYELLSGRPPFKAETPLETLQQVQSQQPVSPSRLQPKLPRDLVTMCLKCLQKEPAKRYASAEALAEDLDRFLQGKPIQARPIGNAERLWRWCRRNPAWASLASSVSLLLVVIAVGASLSAWWLGQERNAALANLDRAKKAERYLGEQLGQRRVGRQPRQSASLERLRQAAQVARSLNLDPETLQKSLLELRSEAITCLALPDLREVHGWPGHALDFDTPLERYAQSDRQGNIHLRRVSDDAELLLKPLPGPGVPPKEVQCRFSPDSRWLAVWYDLDQPNRQLVLWDLPTQEKVFDELVPTPHWHAAFSSDSRWLAFVSDTTGSIRLFDCRERHEGKSIGRGLRATSLAFHPDGRQLAFTSGQVAIVGILDVASGETVAMFPNPAGNGQLAWSPDGRLLAAGGSTGKIDLWDVPERRQRAVLEDPQGVDRLLFSSTGELLASTSFLYDATSLWDPGTGQHLLRIQGWLHKFGPGDRQAALGHSGTLGIWDVVRGRAFTTWRRAAVTVDFGLDGRLLAAAGADGVGLWDVQAARPVGDLRLDYCETAAFQPKGHCLVTDGKTSGLRVWPLRSDPPERPTVLHVGPPQVIPVEIPQHFRPRACWSQDGRWLAALNNRPSGDRVFLFNAHQLADVRTLEEVQGPSRRAETIALSPDGQWVAAGNMHKRPFRVWQTTNLAVSHDLPPKYGTAAFSPNGEWLVTAGDDDYCCWRVDSWQPIRRWPRDDIASGRVAPLAFAPAGDLLAVALRPQEIELVDPESDQVFARLVSPAPAQFTGICFSPDGTRLAVAKANQEVDLWDLRLIRRELHRLGLDWNRDPFPPSAAPGKVPPLRVHVVEAAANDPAQAWRSYWRLRGEADRWRGAWTEVVIDFTEALTILPADAPASNRASLLQRRAEGYVQLQAYDAARDDWEQVVVLQPDNAVACHELARVYVTGPSRLRDPVKAVALARNAVELAPNESAYRTTLGVAYYRLGRYGLAVATLEQSLKASQGETVTKDLFVLAMCYARLGQATQARECYDRAVGWIQERQQKLPAKTREELKALRAEADAVLGPPAERRAP